MVPKRCLILVVGFDELPGLIEHLDTMDNLVPTCFGICYYYMLEYFHLYVAIGPFM